MFWYVQWTCYHIGLGYLREWPLRPPRPHISSQVHQIPPIDMNDLHQRVIRDARAMRRLHMIMLYTFVFRNQDMTTRALRCINRNVAQIEGISK